MIHCKKNIIAAYFTLILPLTGWSAAPVVDDSENFAIINGQQGHSASVANSKYDDPQIENAELDSPRNARYQIDDPQSDDGLALAKDDQMGEPGNDIEDSAKLIDKIQSLQQEVQELRGQLEVQAHDLKLLQQQQIAFYKDLDSRLGNTGAKSAQSNAPTDISIGAKAPTAQIVAPVAIPLKTNSSKIVTPVTGPVSRINPADEQISYMAAYELVKDRRYDAAEKAMHTFVQKYPNGGYTANAQYWLGELYMVKKDYANAIEHFNVVLTQFTSSPKTAASMLKIGYAYTATGDKQEAKRVLQQVIQKFPDTTSAKLAATKLETINKS